MHKRTHAQHLQKVEEIAEKAAQLLCAADINDKIKIAFAENLLYEPVTVKECANVAEAYINPNRNDYENLYPDLPAPNTQETRLYLVFICYLFLHLLEDGEETSEFQTAFTNAQNFISSINADFGTFADIAKFKSHVLGCLFEQFNLGAKSMAQYNREQAELIDGAKKYAFWHGKEVWQICFCEVTEKKYFSLAFPQPLYPEPFYFATSSQKTIAKKNKLKK
jgi:hypothetical protein